MCSNVATTKKSNKINMKNNKTIKNRDITKVQLQKIRGEMIKKRRWRARSAACFATADEDSAKAERLASFTKAV